MGVKWIGRLKVEYEMEEGQPKNLAEMVLVREAAALERSNSHARTFIAAEHPSQLR